MVGGVTCPNCGKDNPDFLDNCQFCQTALRRESTLNIGENPTKKVTGELEGVLPDWLRDARQQSRDSAEEDAKKEDTKPRGQKEEPVDLLAGLAFQASSDDEDVPDWLAAINPVQNKNEPASSKLAKEEAVDFFAQFNEPAADSPLLGLGGISQDETSSQMANIADDIQKDELTGWLSSEQPRESQDDNSWMNNLGAPVSPEPEKPAEPEDLGWLHDLESSAKQAAPPSTPQADMGWMSNLDSFPEQASGSQEDLSWLNNLGGVAAPSFNEPAPAQPASSQEDLGWLNNLGGMPAPSLNESVPAQPTSSQEDLGWLNNLGGTPAPSFDQSLPAQPASPSEDLDWLNNLGSTSVSAQPASSQEDLGWLNDLAGTSTPSFNEPVQVQPTAQEDLDWLNNLGGTTAPSFDQASPAQPASSSEDLDWLNNLGSTSAPSLNESVPAQPTSSSEDLGWLNDLAGTSTPSFNEPVQAQPAAQEDLDWLSNLGGTPAPSFNESVPVQPAAQEDLGWLNDLGNTPAPSFNESAPAQPAAQEDLDWLSNLGSTPESSQPAVQPAAQEDLNWLSNLGGTPAPTQPSSSQEDLGWLNDLVGGTPTLSLNEPVQPLASQEDLGWLNNLGSTPEPSQPATPQEDLDWLSNLSNTPAPSFNESAPAKPSSSQEDLSWLNDLGGAPASSTEPAPSPFAKTDQLKLKENPPDIPISPFVPRRTAPLNEETSSEQMPDWLKDATEAPAMPALGAVSEDRFTSPEKSADELPFSFAETDKAGALTQGMPASADQNVFATSSDSSSLSNQDIDSLFAVDMPDWLSQPDPSAGGASASSTPGGIPSAVDDSLAPVNLPSWVQAMRPVEAAITEPLAASVDQNTEQQGPLAGFRGVIPFAPIGSAQRPKAISLKLQATEEQQTTAALLEQILASETTAHPLKAAPFVASQRVLRWVLTGLFLSVLGVMIGLRSQFVPVVVSNIQMAEINNMATTLQGIPESAPLLVVIDYEPALAGEMEVAAGPLLNQIVVSRRPNLTFISTSPSGSGLVERLVANTKISEPAPDGLGYQLGSEYFNVGYLPGGSAGVHGFIEQPKNVTPAVQVSLFSDFAAVLVITDHAESGLVWIEQVELMKQSNPALANQPLLIVASAQAGPLLQPYVSSKQVNGMISGLSDASRYEYINGSRPGIARSYWDAFGAGLFMAIVAIVLGSLWSLFTGIRSQRAKAEQG